MKGSRPDREVGLLDLLGVLRNNLKILALLAVVFSLIGVALVLLLPREYEKQVTLSVTPVTSPSLGRLVQESDRLDLEALRPDEAGQLAVGYLRENKLAGAQMNPRYDKNTQQIDVSLTSGNRRALQDAVPALVGLTREGFEDVTEDSLRAALESQGVEVGRTIEVQERVVSQLEGEIAALAPEETARLQALENSRVLLLTEVAEAQIRQEDIARAQGELPRLASELINAEVVNESGIRRSRSPLVMLPLAVAAGIGAASAVTLALAALQRRRKR